MADVTDIPPGETLDGTLTLDLPPGETPDMPTLDLSSPMTEPYTRGFLTSLKGQAKQSTIVGGGSLAADTDTVARGGNKRQRSQADRRRTISGIQGPEGGTALPSAPQDDQIDPALAQQQQAAAERRLIEQIAYEQSPSFTSVSGSLGTLAGGILAPENLVTNFSGFIVRRFPVWLGGGAGSSYGQVAIRTGLDAAAGNTLTDPIVQGIRMGSGFQPEYNWTQTVIESPLSGFAGGAALGVGMKGIGAGFARATEGTATWLRERVGADKDLTPEELFALRDKKINDALGIEQGTTTPENLLPPVEPAPKPDAVRADEAEASKPPPMPMVGEEPPPTKAPSEGYSDNWYTSDEWKTGPLTDLPDDLKILLKDPAVKVADNGRLVRVDPETGGRTGYSMQPSVGADGLKSAFNLPFGIRSIEDARVAYNLLGGASKIEEANNAAVSQNFLTGGGKEIAEADKQLEALSGKKIEDIISPADKADQELAALATKMEELLAEDADKLNKLAQAGKLTQVLEDVANGTSPGEAASRALGNKDAPKPDVAFNPTPMPGAQKVSGPKGTNPGGVFKDASGKEFYVKQYVNEAQARTEVGAAQVYELAGAPTLRPVMRAVEGKTSVATQMRKLEKVDPSKVTDKEAEDIGRAYAAAVITGNRDVVGDGFDNLMRDPATGRIVQTDLGGAFEFRAQGQPKPYDGEIDDARGLLNKQYAAGQFFNKVIAAQGDAFWRGANAATEAAMMVTSKQYADIFSKMADNLNMMTPLNQRVANLYFALEKLQAELTPPKVEATPPKKGKAESAKGEKDADSVIAAVLKKHDDTGKAVKSELQKIIKATEGATDTKHKLINSLAAEAIASGKKTSKAIFESIKNVLKSTEQEYSPDTKTGAFWTDLFEGLNKFSSGLAMDVAARMKRAAAMGFDTKLTLYHGTHKDFDSFDPKLGHNGEKAIFFTDVPQVADWYANKGKAYYDGKNYAPINVIPVLWKPGKNRVVDAKNTNYSNDKMVKLINESRAQGYDTITVKNMFDVGLSSKTQTQYVVLNPNNVRSKYGAAFNPNYAASANLLALNKKLLPEFANSFEGSVPVEKGFETVPGYAVQSPEKVKLLGDIARDLVEDMQIVARMTGVTAGNRAIFDPKSGVIAVKNADDLEAVMHEIGHAVHLHGGKKAEFDAWFNKHAPAMPFLKLPDISQDKWRMEGVAHYFWGYLSNPKFLELNNPQAFFDFETLLKNTLSPEQLTGISKARAAFEKLNKATDEELVLAGMADKASNKGGVADEISRRVREAVTTSGSLGDKMAVALERGTDMMGRVAYSFLDVVYTHVFDRFHPINKMEQYLVKLAKLHGNNIELLPIERAYIHMRMMPYAANRSRAMLASGYVPVGQVDAVGPSYISGLEKAKILGTTFDQDEFAHFDAYLVARRFVAEYTERERLGDNSQIAPLKKAAYENFVKQMDTERPHYIDAAQDIHGFLKNQAQYMFDNGLISKGLFEHMIGKVDYVPVNRDQSDLNLTEMDGLIERAVGSKNSNGILENGMIRRFNGSQKKVLSPLEVISKRVHDIENVVMRNNAVRAIDRLAEIVGPGSGWVARRIPNHKLEAINFNGLEALRSAGEMAGVDKADLAGLMMSAEMLMGDSAMATIFRAMPESNKFMNKNLVFFWENGERRALELNDRAFGQAIFHALSWTTQTETNIVAQIFQLSQVAVRAGVTLSLDFPLVNIVRDQFTAALTGGKKYVPFLSAFKGLYDVVGSNLEEKRGIVLAGADIEGARRFALQGGASGGALIDAIDQFGIESMNVMNLQKGATIPRNPAELTAKIFNTIGKVTEFSEVGTRKGNFTGYYKQAKEDLKLDDVNAVLWATFKANDYIDFRRWGASMGWIRRFVPFLTASLSGTDKEIRVVSTFFSLETKRARGETLSQMEIVELSNARAGMINTIVGGVVLGGTVALLNQDNPFYQAAPNHLKNTNYIVPGIDENGNAIVVPKGFGVVQTIANAVERSFEAAYRKDPRVGILLLEAAGDAFVAPVHNPLMSVGYDVTANWNRFRQRPIVPYHMRTYDTPEQYDAYTSGLARRISATLKASGIEASPMKIDYAMNNLGAGVARDVQFYWDNIFERDRPERQLYDYPVIRRFYKNLSRGSVIVEDFYKMVGQNASDHEGKAAAYAGKIKSGDRQGAEQYYQNLNDEEKAYVAITQFGFEAREKRMHPMLRAKDIVTVTNNAARQVMNNNVVRAEDEDRTRLTMSRLEATPIKLDPRQRAKLHEELLEYQMATARNAMVITGAKGTRGLDRLDTDKIIARMENISPEFTAEFRARLAAKNYVPEATVAERWPEIRRRLLIDGKDADISDLTPPDPTRRRRRRE